MLGGRWRLKEDDQSYFGEEEKIFPYSTRVNIYTK